jgi:hypothetical protein
MPAVRFRIDITGMFHNNPLGVKHGDVLQLDEPWAGRYVNLGYADYVEEKKSAPPVEKAVAPEPETAKLEAPPDVETAAAPKPPVKSAPSRRAGR